MTLKIHSVNYFFSEYPVVDKQFAVIFTKIGATLFSSSVQFELFTFILFKTLTAQNLTESFRNKRSATANHKQPFIADVCLYYHTEHVQNALNPSVISVDYV